ncbi:response regulator transcription factor [Tsuneonella sp. HG094]
MNAISRLSPERSLGQLSPRQREVLALVGAHMTNKEIARELDIAITTVDKHLRSIRDKWGTASRYETARVMQQLGGWEKPHPDFSSHDEYLITDQGLSPDLPRSSEFVLQDVLASGQNRQFEVPAPPGLEALDERFGKSWRVALIPLSALLFGLVLIWALIFAKELNDLL